MTLTVLVCHRTKQKTKILLINRNNVSHLHRAFDHVFETVSCADDTKFLIHASYCEIYNEEIRDLLGKDIKAKLELHEHPEKGVYVNGIKLVLI
jgi:hypothetical protein